MKHILALVHSQIVLPKIYLHCIKGKFRVGVVDNFKKASNYMNKMMVAQSDRSYFSLLICATCLFNGR